MRRDYRQYLRILIGAAAGWVLSLVVPGIEPVVGLGCGIAAGLALGTGNVKGR